jgi:hypothetical protein
MYEPAVVSLIDILGFKELVRSSPSGEEVFEALKLFHDFSGANERAQYDYSPKAFAFSDLVIRVRRLKPSAEMMHPIGLLIHEIADLQLTQALLIDQNIFVRGAVTYGYISMSRGLLFGPAFLEAHALESEFAKYPRIVVSERALQGLQDTARPLAECTDRSYEKELVRDQLRQAEDGFWFIDYLSGIARDLEPPEAYVEFLLRHRDVVKLRSKGLANSQVLSDKNTAKEVLIYKWLVCYHNRCVDELSREWLIEHHLDRNDLRIPAQDTSFLYDF